MIIIIFIISNTSYNISHHRHDALTWKKNQNCNECQAIKYKKKETLQKSWRFSLNIKKNNIATRICNIPFIVIIMAKSSSSIKKRTFKHIKILLQLPEQKDRQTDGRLEAWTKVWYQQSFCNSHCKQLTFTVLPLKNQKNFKLLHSTTIFHFLSISSFFRTCAGLQLNGNFCSGLSMSWPAMVLAVWMVVGS